MGQPTYQELLTEHDWLRNRVRELEEENARLKGELGYDIPVKKQEPSAMLTLSLQEKVDLFRSLFKGREDVFARRWYSRTTGKAGYQPVCSNEWDHQLCNKKKFKCAECPNRQFSPLTDGDFYKHLSGKDEEGRDVIGVYAIMDDNTCNFLCADFDDKNCEHGYQKDVLAFTAVCKQSIIMACPKIKYGRLSLIADRLWELVTSVIAIQIFTKEENEDVVKLRISGIGITLKPDINFNCCIVDKAHIWYGSVNILGYHSTEDNIINFHDADTAKDILEMLYR